MSEAADKLVQAKKSLLDDLSRQTFETPQQAMDAVMKLQHLHTQVAQFRDQIQANAAEDFTSRDIETIEEMKQKRIPEEKIAEYFGTNQTKINRLRNGKIPVSDD
ncbi:TPA: hypothetical protein OW393_001730 [Pseudomonas aeruginosa]|nr:hypothetical protein [Pseudomonas aeruginosa]HCW0462642.1 hypothetical protein [Pseudomonas aeruginosa]HCW0889165.1 hypothetical protein [Pseudomonas aeruginosa]HCW0895101.1 hypothetical protein [Pseudomonas aeruginosa]